MDRPLGTIYDNVMRHLRPLKDHATRGWCRLLSVENKRERGSQALRREHDASLDARSPRCDPRMIESGDLVSDSLEHTLPTFDVS